MKQVTILVAFTADIPDDVRLENVMMCIETPSIEVHDFIEGKHIANVEEDYETVSVDLADNPSC